LESNKRCEKAWRRAMIQNKGVLHPARGSSHNPNTLSSNLDKLENQSRKELKGHVPPISLWPPWLSHC